MYGKLKTLVQRLIGKLHPSPSRAHFDFYPFLPHATQATNGPAFDEPKTNSIENAQGTSLTYQVSLLSTLYILELVANKICIDTSQFFNCLRTNPYKNQKKSNFFGKA